MDSIVTKPAPVSANLMGAKDGSGNLQALTIDGSGNLNVTGSFTASIDYSGVPGSAVPAHAAYVGGTDGTNLRGIKVSTAGVVSVDGSGSNVTVVQPTGTNLHAVIDSGTLTAVTAITNALPTGSNIIGRVGIDQTTPGTTNAVAQSGTWTVQPGNTVNTTAWLVKESLSSTSTVTSVASSASSVSILASNASRLGAMFFNDSTQVLYLKLGATASTSSYTVQLVANGYYELPPAHIYTGAIDGIWASANGNLRITELS